MSWPSSIKSALPSVWARWTDCCQSWGAFDVSSSSQLCPFPHMTIFSENLSPKMLLSKYTTVKLDSVLAMVSAHWTKSKVSVLR